VASRLGGLVISPISGPAEIRAWWSTVGALEGDGPVGSRCYVCCLAVGHMDDGRQRRSSFATASDEVGGVGIW
jgi:hypothetical protein